MSSGWTILFKIFMGITFLMIDSTCFAELVTNLPTYPNQIKHRSFLGGPHKQHRLLFTINADKGRLLRIKDQTYHLILHDVHHSVSYVVASNLHNKKLLSLNDFLKQWQQATVQHKFNYTVQSDISGVKKDEQDMDRIPLYQNVYLRGPHYEEGISTIDFMVEINQINQHQLQDIEEFTNVTLYINGCDICPCTSTTIQCQDELKIE